MTLDCSTIGEVEFTANSCLFTPDGADYTGQEIFVTTASDFSNADCKKKITSSNETLVFSWSYQAAQTCGWTWSQDGNDLKFENSLKVSGNSNKITTGGVTLTIADNADDIPLSCSFGNSFTIQSDVVDSEESTKNQNASTSATGDISSAFSMELKEGLLLFGNSDFAKIKFFKLHSHKILDFYSEKKLLKNVSFKNIEIVKTKNNLF